MIEYSYFRIRLSIPNNAIEANRDVDGKRKGFILPLIATTALRIEKDAFKIDKNTTSSIFSGFRATYAYAPPITNV
jgi:hypothetical protein